MCREMSPERALFPGGSGPHLEPTRVDNPHPKQHLGWLISIAQLMVVTNWRTDAQTTKHRKQYAASYASRCEYGLKREVFPKPHRETLISVSVALSHQLRDHANRRDVILGDRLIGLRLSKWRSAGEISSYWTAPVVATELASVKHFGGCRLALTCMA